MQRLIPAHLLVSSAGPQKSTEKLIPLTHEERRNPQPCYPPSPCADGYPASIAFPAVGHWSANLAAPGARGVPASLSVMVSFLLDGPRNLRFYSRPAQEEPDEAMVLVADRQFGLQFPKLLDERFQFFLLQLIDLLEQLF